MLDDTPTALVTGAASGLGFGAAQRLSRADWRVLVHARSERRADDAVRRLSGGRGQVEPVVADFDHLNAVSRLAEDVEARTGRLDALINNAGVATPNVQMLRRLVTADGYLGEWQVNFLAPFALTVLLSGLLANSARARVVNVSSVAQGWGRIHWDDRNMEHGWDRMAAYAQSKIALTMFTSEFALRMAGTRVTANSLHPGMCNTKMVRSTFLVAPHSVRYGANNIIRLVLAPDLAATTGRYFEGPSLTTPNFLAADTQARRRLWDLAVTDTRLDTSHPSIAPALRSHLAEPP